MNEHALTVLELPKILDRVAGHAAFSASKDLVLGARPSADADVVRRELKLTSEARRLLEIRPGFGIGGARDIRPAIERATRGGILEPEELLEIETTLASSRVLRSAVTKAYTDVPGLADIAQLIVDRPALEGDISRCISENNTVLDSASADLARIRAELRVTHQRLLDRLNDIISSSAYRTVLQDSLVTVREGRYVVPIKSEARGQFSGIIHDQSASGATIFVEPLVTVEINNRWRQLQIEERHEVERILRELSGYVASNAAELNGNVEAVARIDELLARARYAAEIGAIEPVVATGIPPLVGLNLIKARHPLLTGHVVPTDFSIGDGYSVVVITGPNTGGKTVALKTVGLLTLMAQTGLHIPAEDGSRIRVFQQVHADIGDEQSIEQSLSTFSSHLGRIVNILGDVSDGSLVVLDEVGAGTDPTEGSALARAILNHLRERGAWVVATTHYAELKAFAQNTTGVRNASVEFNVETLAPTFKLTIGVPGRSNALAIARRLGLPEEIVDDARSMVGPEDQQIEDLLASIQDERDRASYEREQLGVERRRAGQARRQVEQRLAEIDQERQELLATTREEARQELEAFRQEMRRAVASIGRSSEAADVVVEANRAIQQAQRELRTLPVIRPRRAESEPDQPVAPLRTGSRVRVRGVGQAGEIASIDAQSGRAEVVIGNFRTVVDLSSLERLEGAAAVESRPVPLPAVTVSSHERSAPLQLDIRGRRAEEAIEELERYLDDAFLTGLPFVRIVHGKGTGALRQVVRDLLSGSPLVDSFAGADQREGGEGATVAKLRLG